MSSIRKAMLTLLAREPLTGYDIKQQMNTRMGAFWKANNNQVYPELSKMEEEGLIRLKEVEHDSYRPPRKVYEITQAGKESLIEWTIEPVEIATIKDEFLVKAYNTWLVDPEKMLIRIEEARNLHIEKLSIYLDKMEELKGMLDPNLKFDPISSSMDVVEHGILYERMYIQWCDKVIKKLQKSK
ncbi:PadR family transcriptional regulator [Bacillus sp. JJ1764]|uniref:PadR family transcriptional regulator n=1 Tax=Bacillus sp. JJ1764 TaxID=3122964 RepID=UPI0030008F9B